MSNQNFYEGQQSHGGQQSAYVDPQDNPWEDESGSRPQQQYQPPVGLAPSHQDPWQEEQSPQQHHSNNPYQQTQPPQLPQRNQALPPEERALDFVPEAERGEQMETMQDFEAHKSKPDSQQDLDVATLQKEFPDVDGSLIAAIHGDSGSVGATREMLQEIGRA